jgi:hypothetical protein
MINTYLKVLNALMHNELQEHTFYKRHAARSNHLEQAGMDGA